MVNRLGFFSKEFSVDLSGLGFIFAAVADEREAA